MRNRRCTQCPTWAQLAGLLFLILLAAAILAQFALPPAHEGGEETNCLTIAWPVLAIALACCIIGAVWRLMPQPEAAPAAEETPVVFDTEEEFANVDMDEEWERITAKEGRAA